MAESKALSTGAEQLITEHLDIWTTAIEQKSSSGRGSSKKLSLYGIKKLRELILELAVRGKLVPQDPNDEPASVLLERIAAEKAQLIKDKKIKKPKALPEISDEEKSFDIPSGWERERIGTFGIVGTGSTPSRSNPAYWEPAEINWVSSGETSGFFVGSTKEKVSQLAIRETNVSVYPIGTLIVAMYGQGKTRGQITELSEPAGTNQACAAIRLVDTSPPHKNFIKLFFRKAYLELRKHAAGGAQPNLNVGKISNTVIPIPPLEEQSRIVVKVDELMGLCDALEAQTENSITAHQTLVEVLLEALLKAPEQTVTPEQTAEKFQQNWQRLSEHFDTLFTTTASIDMLKQTILQLAVMGKLVPQNPNDEPAAKLLERIAAEKAQLIKDKLYQKSSKLKPKDDSITYPKGWVCVQTGEVCPSIVPNRDRPKSFTGNIPWVTLPAFPNMSLYLDCSKVELNLSESEVKQYSARLIPEGSVLMSCVGRFGLTAINLEAVTSNQQVHAFIVLKGLLPEYLSLVIKVESKALESVATSTTIAYLNKTNCESIQFGLPPSAEQHRIVAKVVELMTLCDQLKARLTDAQTTKLHLTDAIVEQAL
ncbi:restriction endonuclease subunit S [Pseudoalteromonas sp. SG43-7]|uniref:restriction endonuclease subunit S n=1 Tax=Pseudoalteromonas sp. SG43-7 TaxID=2760966 RepID=UPI0016039B5A|nr:restriction endonuclease subunit S [Pseudoalteromonas sp. SG43-7]MBB1423246.1 restriction endonuclease subunit S [Pseudoalteromonas sp. SG43-7]